MVFDYYKGNTFITNDIFATLGLKIHGGKNVPFVWNIFRVLVLSIFWSNTQ